MARQDFAALDIGHEDDFFSWKPTSTVPFLATWRTDRRAR
jgi:hypothetical protein